jgi:tetratricopeptide (TPR) repeat protein
MGEGKTRPDGDVAKNRIQLLAIIVHFAEACHGSQVNRLAFTGAGGFSARMRIASLAAFFLVASTAAVTAQVSILDDTSIGGRNRYENCLLLVRSEPQRALNAALDWEKNGNAAGTHCASMALVALRRYTDAAIKLDKLARVTPGAADSATLYDQAGNAWLLGRRPSDANASFSAAIALLPGDPDLLADRARAYAMAANWHAADADLTAALAKSPGRADLYVLRASARHALGRKADARADIDQALRAQPGNADALEERGELKAEAGDAAGAQKDWQMVMAQAPHSAAAATARQNLATVTQPAAAPAH